MEASVDWLAAVTHGSLCWAAVGMGLLGVRGPAEAGLEMGEA